MEVGKGMYGLPQAGILANKKLVKYLRPFGYIPVPLTPGLWKHVTKPISFTLIVDDFGVKYTDKSDVLHLISALEQQYQITQDWTSKRYSGMSLKWDYKNRSVQVSMPGYIQAMLHKYQHPKPARPQHAPSYSPPPQFDKTLQAPIPPNEGSSLSGQQSKRIQQIVGTLLFYAQAVQPTILVALNNIALQQALCTTTTQKAVNHLLDYCWTHQEATIQYKGSKMMLHVDSNASYLSLPKAKSRVGGLFYLSS